MNRPRNFPSCWPALVGVLFHTLTVGCFGQLPTLLDRGFDTEPGADDDVFAIARQPDGRYLIAGQFTSYHNQTRGRLARLEASGGLDPSFLVGSGANNSIYAVAVQADGRILIGGAFTGVQGYNLSYLARIEANGNIDAAFSSGLAINNELRSIIVEPDGKILIAGRFTQVGGQSRNRIARLNSDGSLDATFNPGAGASDNIRAMLRLADGRILIGGQFTNYNGTARVRLARLLSNGSLDLTFDPGLGVDDQVRAIATNSAAQIYIGGDFDQYNGTNRSGVARLFPNGALDLSFDQGYPENSGYFVRGLAVQPDGKIWIGGLFFKAGGQFRSNLARLNSDGSADDFFIPPVAMNGEVFALDYDGGNRLLVGGKFTRVDNNLVARRLAMLAPQSQSMLFVFQSFDLGAAENSGVARVGLQRRGWLGGPASVGMITRNGTAIAGEDFVNYAGQVHFAPNQFTGTAEVTLIDDAYPEGEESFEVEVVNPPGIPAGAVNQIQQFVIEDNEFQAAIDESFRPDSVNGPIYAAAVQPDGKVAIGGEFLYRGGCLENYFSRLSANGTVDCDFYVHSFGANEPVYSVSLQADGHIIAGGAFTYFNSKPAHFLVRVETNGITDTNFVAGTNLNGGVLVTAVQPDGRILIGGMFTAYGATPRSYLARLHPDGSLDASFNPMLNLDGFVRAIRLTANGRIFIAGDFALIDGTPRSRIARLSSDGALDSTFDPGPGPNGSVLALAEQSDGRVVITGEFSQVDNQPRERVARLQVGGGLDTGFDVGSFAGGPRVNTVAVQADGKIVFGGLFSYVGQAFRPHIARVHANGALDTGFLPSSGANGEVHSVQVLPDGQLLVAGNFTRLGGVPRLYIARVDPEPSLNRIEMAQGSFNIGESDGTAIVEVRRAGQSGGTVSVNYATVAGTAQPAVDFAPRSGTLTFAPLETVKSITIPLINDGLPENAEQFRVRLSNPGGGAILGPLAETIVEVVDNDAGLEVEPPEVTVREGASEVTFLVRRNSDGPETITVNFATVNGTALAGSDYFATNGVLTFPPDRFTNSVTVALRDNPEFEGRESFRFVLSNPTPGAGLGANGEATVFIDDQDSAFYLNSVYGSGEPDGRALGHVYRYGIAAEAATVRVRSDGGTAIAGQDYLPLDVTLSFAPGEGIQYFYITNLNDGLVEGTETIRVVLSEPTGFSIIADPGETNVQVFDNDEGIELIAPAFYVNEFSPNARAIVRRGDDGTNLLTVRISTSDETAAAGPDYTALSTTIVLPPGETNAAVLIPIRQDSLLETNESFAVTLSQPGALGTLGTQSVARVVILDDERAGSLDLAFLADARNISPYGLYGAPIYLSVHTGNKLLAGAQGGLARLHRDGTADTNFVDYPNYFFFAPVSVQRPDGKIYVGGSSSNTIGAGASCLRLLETNGAILPAFAFPINQGRAAAIALQPDGKILIGGDFSGAGPAGYTSLLRVLPTGELDPGFTLATFSHSNPYYINPSTVEAVALQPDGKILAAGQFTTVAGQARQNIVRFNADGSVDPAFRGPSVLPPTLPAVQFPDFSSYFVALALQPDGRIIVGGAFTNVGGVRANNLSRLNPDGSRDATFTSPLSAAQTVTAIALQPDDKLLVAVSRFGYFNDTGAPSFVVRLLANGEVDVSFDAGQSPDGRITDLILLPGGDIAIGGGFTEVNGIHRPLVARLKGDGLKLGIAPSASGLVALHLFNTWPGGVTILEESTNLIEWQSIQTSTATGPSQQWLLPVTGPQRFFRARHSAP